jgi:hypothetical protein
MQLTARQAGASVHPAAAPATITTKKVKRKRTWEAEVAAAVEATYGGGGPGEESFAGADACKGVWRNKG